MGYRVGSEAITGIIKLDPEKYLREIDAK